MMVIFVAGSGKSVFWFMGFEILLPTVTDVIHQFHDHTRYPSHVQAGTSVDVLLLS